MKAGWERKKLGDVLVKTQQVNPARDPGREFKYIDVSSVNNKTFTVENVSIIKGRNAPSRARKLVKFGDIIFATVRPTLRRIAFIPKELDGQVCSTGYFVLRASPNIDAKYIFYYLLSDQFNQNMLRLQKGASYPAVTDKDVREQILGYPKSISEQERIVAILDEAFAAIAKAKANAEQNLKNAKELFKSYLQEVFENKGENWEDGSVQEFVDADVIYKPLDGNHGEAHPLKSDYVDVGVPFIMSRDMRDGSIDEKSCKFISEKQARNLRTGFARNGDVLLSHKGTIGSVALLQTENDFVVLTPQITYYRIKDHSKVINKFIYYQFLSPGFQKIINEIAEGGSTRAYIGITKQLTLKLIIAPLKDQQTIVQKLDALSAEIKKLEVIYQAKINALEELKKSVLQKAFSGELTQTEVES